MQNDGALHAEQARREELQHDLLAQQQVAQQQMLNVQLELAQRSYAHQEQLQVLADQERERQAIEMLRRQREAEAAHQRQEQEMLHCQHEAEAACQRQELEMLHRQCEAEAERQRQELEMLHRQQELVTQQRREQEQRHLDELYQKYGPQSVEQHAEDQARNQDNCPNNPNEEFPHNDPVPPVQEPVPPNEPNVPVPQPSPPPPPPPWQQPFPPGGRPYREPMAKSNLGAMSVECQHCHALHFDCEKLSKSTRNNIVFGMCCLEGLVQLPPFPQWPVTLQNLFQNHHFREHIQQYNSSLAFTSLGVEVDRHTVQGSGPAAFRIHGALYHLMGSLIPTEG